MNFGVYSNESALIAIYREVSKLNQDWQADFGVQQCDGWIPGSAVEHPDRPPFSQLLARISNVIGSTDRRTIAAAFVVRLAWSAGDAIAPYMMRQCVPDTRLSNISLRFSEDCLFQKLSIHQPRAVVLRPHEMSHHYNMNEFLRWTRFGFEFADRPVDADSSLLIFPDSRLRSALRRVLLGQSLPVLRSLQQWSHGSKHALWEQFTVSWAIQIAAVQSYLQQRAEIAKWHN
jgi:hypothetical protein